MQTFAIPGAIASDMIILRCVTLEASSLRVVALHGIVKENYMDILSFFEDNHPGWGLGFRLMRLQRIFSRPQRPYYGDPKNRSLSQDLAYMKDQKRYRKDMADYVKFLNDELPYEKLSKDIRYYNEGKSSLAFDILYRLVMTFIGSAVYLAGFILKTVGAVIASPYLIAKHGASKFWEAFKDILNCTLGCLFVTVTWIPESVFVIFSKGVRGIARLATKATDRDAFCAEKSDADKDVSVSVKEISAPIASPLQDSDVESQSFELSDNADHKSGLSAGT